MSYFDLRNKQKKKLSFNNLKDNKEIERELYQKFLRTKEETEKYVDSEHLENVFTNEIYYRAMKEIPKIEKQILYLSVYEYKTLNEICKTLKKTKREVKDLREKAVKHFRENIQKYEKNHTKKAGDLNEQ